VRAERETTRFETEPRCDSKPNRTEPHTMTRAAALFRRIVRAARALDRVERADAVAEARASFRARADVAGAALEDALERGEQRLAIASHYGIASERMAHAKLAGGGNKDVEVPSTKAFNAAVARAQFPVNPANAAARAKARARRGAVANAERRGGERGNPSVPVI